MGLVEYVVARNGVPERSGVAYDYVLAGDGLFLATENRHLCARVPVADCRVRGLPEIGAAFALLRGRLPHSLWVGVVHEARYYSDLGDEVLLAVTSYGDWSYRLERPEQDTTAASVRYRPSADALLEIHSHHRMPAYFSTTDNRDEQGLRLYGVVGRLDTERPEVALRVGAYGHWLPVPWEAVFEGDRGSFWDVHYEPGVNAGEAAIDDTDYGDGPDSTEVVL